MVSLPIKQKFLNPDHDDLGIGGNALPLSEKEIPFVFNVNHSLTIQDQQERLPIRKYLKNILYCLEETQIVVLVGETGSGKSTQIPQYLYDWGWHESGNIGNTEPQRISTLALADRVSLERGELVGRTVGFIAKFATHVSSDTKIKYITESMFLRELLEDPLLTKYSVIIVDDAHERTLFTDILLGLLKKVAIKRVYLKIVILSATIDAISFRDYFNYSQKYSKVNSCSILSVGSKMFPVNIFYLEKPCVDYVRETVHTILKIQKRERAGDILAFLTGQSDVLEAMNMIRESTSEEDFEGLQILPLYGNLSNHELLQVFFTAPKGKRKVVLATSIAETAVTIPGILFVVDCGFVKVKWFNPSNFTECLVTVPISKASAIQRAGRAGRLGSGKVYRLYTEETYIGFPDALPPEMRRAELSAVVLHLKALGVANILRFNFPSAPPTKNLLAALETLYALEAIDNNGHLTNPLGYIMTQMPIDPMMSRMLYISGQLGCSEEIITIIAMLLSQPVFSKTVAPLAHNKYSIAKRRFEVEQGDLLTLLNVYMAYMESDRNKEFCDRHFLSYRSMKRAKKLHEQLTSLAIKFGIPLFSCKGNVEIVCKCITAGFFLNATYLHSTGVYKTMRRETELSIHPLSQFYTLAQPQFVVYTELLQTTSLFMNNLTPVREEWLTELAPHYYCKKPLQN